MKQIRGIWLPDRDTHFEAHLLAGPEFEGRGTYQHAKVLLALAATPEGRRELAVDVGAHVGLWSRVLARSFVQLEAFEPVASLRECWDLNMADGPANVMLHPLAVSDRAGELDFEIVEANSGNCRVYAAGMGSDPYAANVGGDRWGNDKVTAINLDGWPFERRVDFIKIDVEGWELRVVQGAEQVIRRDRPVVVVEQKPGHAERYGIGRREAVDLLANWGMVAAWEKAGDVCMRWQ